MARNRASKGAGNGQSRLGRIAEGLAFVLPIVAVTSVALAVLVIGRPRAVAGVRIRGGPTVGVRALSLRVEGVERLGDVERPLRGKRFDFDVAGRSESGVFDDEGASEIVVRAPATGEVRARIHLGNALPEDVRWSLSIDAWQAGARRRGGWVERRTDGVVLRAAAERGVFAVPFSTPLWVEASHDGSVVDALDVHGDGADVVLAKNAARRKYAVTPREHAASIVVRVPGAPAAELDVSLAVVPGALFAELRDDELVVRSPVARDRAYVAIVGERERITGATVLLSPDATGASGVLHGLELPPKGPLWAVVSSEPEHRSSALVGWPIRFDDAPSSDPPRTFDVPDVLVADTVPAALAREVERVQRVRLLSALIAIVALGGTAAAVAARAAGARARLTEHLSNAGADEDATARVATTGAANVWGVVAAVLSVALAALLFALFSGVAR